MRVSTAQIFQQGVQSMQQRQASLSELLQKISSGQKYLRASEDPFASARALELEQVVTRTGQYQENISLATASLSLQDTVLGDVTTVLQRTRELALQANNSTLTQSDRQSIAVEVRERLGELLGLANTIGADGDYLYAGHQGGASPFESSTVGQQAFVSYRGDQGKRFIQIGESRQLQSTEAGAEVFMRIAATSALTTTVPLTNTGAGTVAPAYVFDPTVASGNTYRIQFNAGGTYDIINETTATTVLAGAAYVAGESIEFDGIRTSIAGAPAVGDVFRFSSGGTQDLFTTLNKFIATLEQPISNAVTAAGLAETLQDIDLAIEHIGAKQTEVGGRLNALEAQQQENEAYKLQTQQALSDLRDLDYADAISQLQHNQFALEAAQASFARIEGLSLFNYLR